MKTKEESTGAKPTISISKSTNSEIDAAVAEYVAGYSRKKVFGWGHTLIWHKGEKPLLNAVFSNEGDPYSEPWEPAYSTDANAVLPLLEQYEDFSVEYSKYGSYYYVYVDMNSATARTFPLAACFSLLRAHGVEVTE